MLLGLHNRSLQRVFGDESNLIVTRAKVKHSSAEGAEEWKNWTYQTGFDQSGQEGDAADRKIQTGSPHFKLLQNQSSSISTHRRLKLIPASAPDVILYVNSKRRQIE